MGRRPQGRQSADRADLRQAAGADPGHLVAPGTASSPSARRPRPGRRKRRGGRARLRPYGVRRVAPGRAAGGAGNRQLPEKTSLSGADSCFGQRKHPIFTGMKWADPGTRRPADRQGDSRPRRPRAVGLGPLARGRLAFAAHAVGPRSARARAGPEDGPPALVIPGFFGTDRTTMELRRALARAGWRAHPWLLGINIGAKTNTMDLLCKRLRRSGGPTHGAGRRLEPGRHVRAAAGAPLSRTRCARW